MGTKINRPAMWLWLASAVLSVSDTMAQTKIRLMPGSQDVQSVTVDELPLAHTAQVIALNPDGELIGKGDPIRQMDQIFSNLANILNTVQTGTGHLVKINICLKEASLMDPVKMELSKRYPDGKGPALSFVVSNLRHPDALLGVDVVAISRVRSPRPPVTSGAAVLPAGAAVYVSGQAAKGNLAEATAATLKQLESTLTHLGLKKEDIVQLKSFVQPAADIHIAEREIARFFGQSQVPPLVFVEWLSEHPIVEIELIARSAKSSTGGQVEYITPPDMTASPVYAKVCRINYGKKIYLSGLYGGPEKDVAGEAKEIFESLKQSISEAGSDLDHLVKATYYVSDTQSSSILNTIRPNYYNPQRPPAASKAMIRGTGKKGTSLTVDMIGVVPQ